MWNRRSLGRVQSHMDTNERTAIRDEGLDPDDPAVIAALDRVTRTLRAHHHLIDGYPWWHLNPGQYRSEQRPSGPPLALEHPFE